MKKDFKISTGMFEVILKLHPVSVLYDNLCLTTNFHIKKFNYICRN